MNTKWKQGYIRTSTLVISAAVLILVAICVLAFSGYIQSSYMVKTNNTAKQIYYAAQNYLDTEKKAGKLDEFNKAAKQFGKALSMDLQERILSENYIGNDLEEKIKKYRKQYAEGDIRYLVLESEKASGENRADNLILKMLQNQVTDKNVQKDSILIEYDSVSGKVLTVFYSKKTERFQYEGDKEGGANVILRNKELLTKKEQGYFGVNFDEILD